jgi:hypothetical protein
VYTVRSPTGTTTTRPCGVMCLTSDVVGMSHGGQGHKPVPEQVLLPYILLYIHWVHPESPLLELDVKGLQYWDTSTVQQRIV